MCFITNTQYDEKNPTTFRPILRMNLYGDGTFSLPVISKDLNNNKEALGDNDSNRFHEDKSVLDNQQLSSYDEDIYTSLDPIAAHLEDDDDEPALYNNNSNNNNNQLLFLQKHYENMIDPMLFMDSYIPAPMSPNRLQNDEDDFLPSRKESFEIYESAESPVKSEQQQQQQQQYVDYLPSMNQSKQTELYSYMPCLNTMPKAIQVETLYPLNYVEYPNVEYNNLQQQQEEEQPIYYQTEAYEQAYPEPEVQQESPQSMPSSPSTWHEQQMNQNFNIDSSNSPQNANSSKSTSTVDEEHNQIMTRICNSNKKNVVKNLMSAFKRFISDLQTDAAAGNSDSISEGVKPHSKISNLRQNLACSGYEMDVEKERKIVIDIFNGSKPKPDSIDEMGKKFKRYISLKQFNHYTIRLLVQHPNYGDIFKYFIESHAMNWLGHSKVDDPYAHKVMIEFLKAAFEDISIIEKLKKHEKRKALFQ